MPSKTDKNVSRMFIHDETMITSDEELALHIYHRFNICSETLEEMPAFKDHLGCFFNKSKEK
ncbi:MAG: hypothetical protein V5A64_02760 [Candidatus Thermoplasmatota archaeon]